MSNDTAIKLGRKLIEIAPKGLRKVFYSDSGSTSVEIALKMAYQYFQQKEGGASKKKTKFLTLKQAYHGDTIGSVSVGGIDLFHEVYHPLLFDTIKLPSPHCYRCPYNKSKETCSYDCFEELEAAFKQYGEETCAFIIEPLVQGAAGILLQPKSYVQKVRELCTAHNVLMIADEVAVGFGKTGALFACERENIVPDILCLAKGITGGYLPLAASLVTEEIYEGFLGNYSDYKTFFHGHTYTGNALACSVALANLELFEKENTIDKLQEKIARLRSHLQKFNNLEHVGDIRQEGIIVGIELVQDKKSKKNYAPHLRMGHQVILKER
jgi:adenosylmethionine-8-amino-7-oxononanoate aminotransferase